MADEDDEYDDRTEAEKEDDEAAEDLRQGAEDMASEIPEENWPDPD